MNKVPYNKAECCGCGVCSNICPKHAIEMRSDEEGFLYPIIDTSTCIDCALCLKYCAFHKREPLHNIKKDTCYILRHKDLSIRMSSRSGGIFVSSSDWILQQSGVIYGAVLDKVKCEHQRANDTIRRNKMCYSKYVQSETQNIWKSIKDDLTNGHKVLFSGTPCQIDALYSYLKYNKTGYVNLYTMDLVCHGVPSPKLFAEFIGYIEKLHGGKVSNFQFRDKTVCGWDDHIESFYVNGHKYTSSKWRDIYNTNGINRPSCSNCKYAAMNRPGDITFGDAWGIRQVAPDLYENRGASIVIANSRKGEQLLQAMALSCDIREVPMQRMTQPNLLKPSKPKINRDRLWQDYRNGGIELLVQKYGTKPFFIRLIKKIRYCLRKVKFACTEVYLPGFYPLKH